MNGIIIFFVICYVTGLLSLFYGKKMVNVLLAIYAFCAAYRFALAHLPSDQYALWIAVGAGILAIVLIKFAKNVAFFLLGAVIGMMIGLALVNFLPAHPDYVSWFFVLACAVILGWLTSHFSGTLIRFGTAYIGGEMVTSATLLLIFGYNSVQGMASADTPATITTITQYLYGDFAAQYSLWILIGAAVLMFIGAAFQKKH